MKLILHIGLEKTGSTSLQELLYNSSKKRFGPLLADQRDLFPYPNHIDLCVHHSVDQSKIKFIKRYSKCKKEFIKKWIFQQKDKHIFFTNEHISSRLSHFEEFKALIDTLSAGDHSITILLITRNYTEWTKSKYTEAVKGGYPYGYSYYLSAGGRWHSRELDFENLLLLLHSLPVDLKVMRYSKNIVEDVLSFVNFELGSSFSSTNKVARSNVRLGERRTIIKLFLNKFLLLDRFFYINRIVNKLLSISFK